MTRKREKSITIRNPEAIQRLMEGRARTGRTYKEIVESALEEMWRREECGRNL